MSKGISRLSDKPDVVSPNIFLFKVVDFGKNSENLDLTYDDGYLRLVWVC